MFDVRLSGTKRKYPDPYVVTTYNEVLHNHVFYAYENYKIKDENEYKNMRSRESPRVMLVLPNTNTHNVIHFRKDYNKVHELVICNKRQRLNPPTDAENAKYINYLQILTYLPVDIWGIVYAYTKDIEYIDYLHNFYILPNLEYSMVEQQPLGKFRFMPHQQFFINWLYFCENNYDIHPLYNSFYTIESCIRNNRFAFIHSRNGALLAMEMGLGKTLIALGLVIASLHDQRYFVSDKKQFPTLYLCPKRIIYQVASEAKRFYHDRLKTLICGKTKLLTVKDIRKHDIVLMSYQSFVYMMKKHLEVICHTRWFRVIADESHKLRECKNVSHQSCNRFPTYRWINMTGTPMFNSIDDIINQVRLTGIDKCKLSIQTNILKSSHSEKSEQVRQIVNTCLKDRVSIVSKQDIMKTEPIPIERHPINVPMNEHEQECYQYILDYFQANAKRKRYNVFFFLSLISILTDLTSSNKLDFQQYPPPDLCFERRKTLNKSTKFKYLKDIILFCRQKTQAAKFIIFDNYRCSLRNSIEYLESRNIIDNENEDSKHKYVYLESKNQSLFQSKVEQFKTDPYTNFMFSTLELSSEGLNLTEASYMIFLQPWYTDSKMKQGEGRIHRIGQTKKVHIFYLMYQNTFEEVVYNISKQKFHEQELLKDCFRKIIKPKKSK